MRKQVKALKSQKFLAKLLLHILALYVGTLLVYGVAIFILYPLNAHLIYLDEVMTFCQSYPNTLVAIHGGLGLLGVALVLQYVIAATRYSMARQKLAKAEMYLQHGIVSWELAPNLNLAPSKQKLKKKA